MSSQFHLKGAPQRRHIIEWLTMHYTRQGVGVGGAGDIIINQTGRQCNRRRDLDEYETRALIRSQRIRSMERIAVSRSRIVKSGWIAVVVLQSTQQQIPETSIRRENKPELRSCGHHLGTGINYTTLIIRRVIEERNWKSTELNQRPRPQSMKPANQPSNREGLRGRFLHLILHRQSTAIS